MDDQSHFLYFNKEVENIRLEHICMIEELRVSLNEWRDLIDKEFQILDSNIRVSRSEQAITAFFDNFWDQKFATTDDYFKKLIKSIKNKRENKLKSKTERPYNTKTLRDEYKEKIIKFSQKYKFEDKHNIDSNAESNFASRKRERSEVGNINDEKTRNIHDRNNLSTIQNYTNNTTRFYSDYEDINKIMKN
jgi:hypothetical protein